MAKFTNYLSLDEVFQFAESKSQLITKDPIPKDTKDALEKFLSDKETKIYIFSHSIAFRRGKSSIKSITGFPLGFKASFKESSKDILNPITFSGTSKLSKVVRFVLLACLANKGAHRDRILTAEDKTEAAESEEVENVKLLLSDLINSSSKGFIQIEIGSKKYTVNGFRQISGRPKADMAFTYKGNDVVFVSHKKGKSAGNFQQYGGLPTDLGFTNNKRTSSLLSQSSNKEVQSFLEEIDLILEYVYKIKRKQGMFDFSDTIAGTNFAFPVNSKEIAELCMFGKDYKTKANVFGQDNVHLIVDGNISLEGSRGVYRVVGEYHTLQNPQISGVVDKLTDLSSLGLYRPMLFISRSSSQGLKNGGFLNARAYVWPNNQIAKSYYEKFLKELNIAKKLAK